MTTQAPLKSIKRGEYVKRKPDATKVYLRGEYDRATKAYELIDTDDINRSVWLKGDTEVTIGFTY